MVKCVSPILTYSLGERCAVAQQSQREISLAEVLFYAPVPRGLELTYYEEKRSIGVLLHYEFLNWRPHPGLPLTRGNWRCNEGRVSARYVREMNRDLVQRTTPAHVPRRYCLKFLMATDVSTAVASHRLARSSR